MKDKNETASWMTLKSSEVHPTKSEQADADFWPNRLWPSLFDRLWPSLIWPTLAKIGVLVFWPNHKEQYIFKKKKHNNQDEKNKEEQNKEGSPGPWVTGGRRAGDRIEPAPGRVEAP